MIRTVRAALALCLPLAGCVAAETTATGAISSGAAVTTTLAAEPEAIAAQPARATYSCGNQGWLTVESRGGFVLVTSPEGDQVELPASPAARRRALARKATRSFWKVRRRST